MLLSRAERNLEQELTSSEIRKDLYDANERGTFDQIAVLSSGFEQVGSVLFHPYENILVAADCKRTIGVWDSKVIFAQAC